MTNRVKWRLVVGVVAWAAAPAAAAADVVVLKSSEASASAPLLAEMRKGLAGHTVTEYDLREDPAEAVRVIASTKGRPVTYVALGAVAARAVRHGAPDRPLAWAMVPDPAAAGVTPAPHVTGVVFAIPIKVQLAVFRQLTPRATRIGVIYNPAQVGPLVDEAVSAAPTVRMQITRRPITSEREIPEALRELLSGAGAVDALWLPPDPTLLSDASRRHILKTTLDAQRPVLAFSPAVVAEGALASHAADPASVGKQVAEAAIRLAAGETGEQIGTMVPVGQLTVNKKIGERLKIEMRPDALQRARVL